MINFKNEKIRAARKTPEIKMDISKVIDKSSHSQKKRLAESTADKKVNSILKGKSVERVASGSSNSGLKISNSRLYIKQKVEKRKVNVIPQVIQQQIIPIPLQAKPSTKIIRSLSPCLTNGVCKSKENSQKKISAVKKPLDYYKEKLLDKMNNISNITVHKSNYSAKSISLSTIGSAKATISASKSKEKKAPILLKQKCLSMINVIKNQPIVFSNQESTNDTSLISNKKFYQKKINLQSNSNTIKPTPGSNIKLNARPISLIKGTADRNKSNAPSDRTDKKLMKDSSYSQSQLMNKSQPTEHSIIHKNNEVVSNDINQTSYRFVLDAILNPYASFNQQDQLLDTLIRKEDMDNLETVRSIVTNTIDLDQNITINYTFMLRSKEATILQKYILTFLSYDNIIAIKSKYIYKEYIKRLSELNKKLFEDRRDSLIEVSIYI